jgi:hypothetical protein
MNRVKRSWVRVAGVVGLISGLLGCTGEVAGAGAPLTVLELEADRAWSIRSEIDERVVRRVEVDGLPGISVSAGDELTWTAIRRDDVVAAADAFGSAEGGHPLTIDADHRASIDALTLEILDEATLAALAPDLAVFAVREADPREASRARPSRMTTVGARCRALADKLDECANDTNNLGSIAYHYYMVAMYPAEYEDECEAAQQEYDLLECSNWVQ